jgi:hypothetical protein
VILTFAFSFQALFCKVILLVDIQECLILLWPECLVLFSLNCQKFCIVQHHTLLSFTLFWLGWGWRHEQPTTKSCINIQDDSVADANDLLTWPARISNAWASQPHKTWQQLQIHTRTASEAVPYEKGNRLVASMWPAAEIVCRDRNKVLCAYVTMCLCLVICTHTTTILFLC